MGLLDKIFKPKREPEWIDVGGVGEGYIDEMKRHAELILRKQGRQGFVPHFVGEPRPGYFGQTTQELQSNVFESLAMTMEAKSPRIRDAIATGNVFFIIGRTADKRRVVALVVKQ